MAKLLIPDKEYKSNGVYIGMKYHTKQMKEFIYKIRPDGLSLLNIKKIDERIRIAAKFLARMEKILVASRKSVAFPMINKFCEIIGGKAVTGRFLPGTLTNPNYKNYFEAEVVFIVDPLTDSQALKEAVKARIPLIAICDTFNETSEIDLIIPANNKGKKSLATIFWLLSREILKNRDEIKSDKEFSYKIEDFMK